MMERITTDPFYEQYHVTVVSRDPWMLQFDNMITPEEAQRLIEYGTTQGYERSSDVGKEQEDGTYDSFVNDGRTSTQSVSFTKFMNYLLYNCYLKTSSHPHTSRTTCIALL